jgi:hypothetical protein
VIVKPLQAPITNPVLRTLVLLGFFWSGTSLKFLIREEDTARAFGKCRRGTLNKSPRVYLPPVIGCIGARRGVDPRVVKVGPLSHPRRRSCMSCYSIPPELR